jgi:N-acetylmuramoyl-L-alanine amidase
MIAICVGHSRPGDSGAVSVGGVSERSANGRLAKQIRAKLEDMDVVCEVIDGYQGANYPQAMRWLGRKLATIKATGAIELHFNFGEPAANGHEWLHWHSSVGGRYLAQALNRSMSSAFPDHQARGLQAVTAKGRGAEFLCCTPCPAVICEPFFGSNPREWAWFAAYQPALAHAIAAGVAAWEKGGRQ